MSKFFKNLKKLLISTKRKLEFSKECLKKYPTLILDKRNGRFEYKCFVEGALKTRCIDETSIKLFFDKNFVEITEDLITGDLNEKIRFPLTEEANGKGIGVFIGITRREFINVLYDFLVEVVFI